MRNDYQFMLNEGLVKHKREITVRENVRTLTLPKLTVKLSKIVKSDLQELSQSCLLVQLWVTSMLCKGVWKNVQCYSN